MKQTINVSQFRDAFKNMGRQDQFSYEGLDALYSYLEETYGEDNELDVIALCCEYSEYESFDELKKQYSDIEDMDDLESNTTVIKIDDESFIIQNY